MRADISQFEALCAGSGGVVFNSAAAVVMQNYDQNKKSVRLCDKYIEQMQAEEYIPAELISQMYVAKEKFSDELLKLKQGVMEQTAKEPLDAFDREIYLSLSEESKADLKIVLDTDKVFRRALEMKDEAAAPERQGTEDSSGNGSTAKESAERNPKRNGEAGKGAAGSESEEKTELSPPDAESDDFALDVSSEEKEEGR